MKRPAHDLTRPGWAIAAAVTVLCGVGLACIYATEAVDGGLPHNTIKQIVFLIAGAALSAGLLRTGYQRVSRQAYLLFACALAALALLLVAKFGHTTMGGLVPVRRGVHRWIAFPGFQLQPSEFMKVAYILALAWYLRFRKNYRTLGGLLPPVVLSLVPMGMILLEPDLGTALLITPVLFAMLFLAGARVGHLALIAGAAACVAPWVWGRIAPYQRARITSVLMQSDTLRARVIAEPDKFRLLSSKREAIEWRRASGMQLVRCKAALGSGGVWGQGWGKGTYVEYDFLPDKHNDVVFAIVGHQWGLLGCLLVLICYGIIVVAGTDIALGTAEPFGRLLAIGVVALLAAQVLINVGMTVGLMPITGMTLPFVSYGGSSLLTNFIATALLISVAQHRPFVLARKPFEFEDDQRDEMEAPPPPRNVTVEQPQPAENTTTR